MYKTNNNLVRSLDESFASLKVKGFNTRLQMGSALELLLWSDVTIMATLSLSAVGCLWWQSSIASSADHFIAFEFSGKISKGWFDLDFTISTTSESKNEMEGRFLLDVVVRKSSSILQLLSSEDESLLIWWDTLFVLDLSPKLFKNHQRY